MLPPWPGLAAALVTLGGVTVTLAEAAEAARVLRDSRSSAIAALLRAAGSPLASCDYWAAARPYLPAARLALEATHKRGCAGRHVAKTAFCEAVCAAVARAVASFLDDAVAALSADHRIAAEIAADAVACRRRELAQRARRQLLASVTGAVRQCQRSKGAPCNRQAACGTGTCPFATPQFAGRDIPAGPGKRERPAGHVPGGTFSEVPALEAWLAAHPYRPSFTVSDGDLAYAGEQAA